MTPEMSFESGRIHVNRIESEADLDGVPQGLATDDYETDDPRYAVFAVDHMGRGSGEARTFLADRINVNGATFATDYVEFGAGGHKRVYRDPDDPHLVRIIVSPKRT